MLKTVSHYHLDAIDANGDYIHGFLVVEMENGLFYLENEWDGDEWKPFEGVDITPCDSEVVSKAFPNLTEAVRRGIEIIHAVYPGARICHGAGCPNKALEELGDV